MRLSCAPSNGQGTFFAAQSSAGCTINISGFDLRQAQDIEAEHRRLNTGDGAPFAIPGLCLVEGLGIAAQNSQVPDGAPRADVVSDRVDF